MKAIATVATILSVSLATLSSAGADSGPRPLSPAPASERPKLVRVAAFGAMLQPLTTDGSLGAQFGVGGELRFGRYSRFLQVDASLTVNNDDFIVRTSASFNQSIGKIFFGAGLGLGGSGIGRWSGETTSVHAQVGAHLFRVLGRRTTLQVRGLLSSVLFDSSVSESLGIARPDGASRPEIVASFGFIF